MASTNEENPLADELAYPILLAERVISAADEAESFKLESVEVKKQANRLAEMLRHMVRSTNPIQSLYERPIRQVAKEASKNLERALTVVRKCRHQNFIFKLFSITSAADFRKVHTLLDASVGDMKWIIRFYETENSGVIGGGGLPPIATNDPILSWVWSYIASIYLGDFRSRSEAANGLASLAHDNDRNKKMIVEEGGVSPLLKLLKENSSPEVQIAAANAIYNLVNDAARVRRFVNEGGVQIIVNVLNDSPMRVQTEAAKLVARMVERDSVVQEDFAKENVIRPLVTLLSFETFDNDPPPFILGTHSKSIHSVLKISKEMKKKKKSAGESKSYSYNSYPSFYGESSSSSSSSSSGSGSGSGKAAQNRRERENESPEVKLYLKTSCAEALWKLARGNVSNSKRIAETKGLLCLGMLVLKEVGELQYNCMMTIMEITAAAEFNNELRRGAFKTNSPAAKAVVDQLLRVIKELNSSMLQIPAIKSIGSLAKTFSAKDKQVLEPLVTQLGNRDEEVAVEAAIALQKFACPENFVCVEHSKAIIEFNGVLTLISLLRGEAMQLHALILLCYLAIHASNDRALEQAKVLNILEGVDHSMVAHHPELRELVPDAIYQLNLYHTVDNPSTAVV